MLQGRVFPQECCKIIISDDKLHRNLARPCKVLKALTISLAKYPPFQAIACYKYGLYGLASLMWQPVHKWTLGPATPYLPLSLLQCFVFYIFVTQAIVTK